MKADHSKLICDIGELTALFTDTSNLDGLLQKIVEMIASHLEAEVCSIYLYDENAQELILKATKGLHSDSIGRVKLKKGEGLTGIALKELRPVCSGDAARHPDYRHFTGIGEEKYCSFLAVPIMRGQSAIGVMTLQTVRKNRFSPEDINIFRAITSQLATTIEMTRLLISLKTNDSSMIAERLDNTVKFIKGRVGAEGFAMGEAMVVAPPSIEDLARFASSDSYTLEDFRKAVSSTEKELEDFQKSVEEKLFDVASLIFSAQILMLKDEAMVGAMEALIKSGVGPIEAVRSVIREYADRFARMPNEFIRDKRYDVIDVGRRLLQNLIGHSEEHAVTERIVIARELLPSDALKLSESNVGGIVLLSGGVTSHVAVLARSLNIPLVIADDSRLLSIPPGTTMILDGNMGNIYINPDREVLERFREKEELKSDAAALKNEIRDTTRTADGEVVTILANINLLGDLVVAREFKAEGVGLYRTEFPFIVRSDFPTEEEQYVIYRRLAEGMKGREITFRTLDIGGDKIISYYDYSKEANPFLGLRSIRFSLKHPDIFMQQLKAILRAGHETEIRIMFPMISSVDELIEAKRILAESMEALKAEKRPFQAKPMVGIMVELPSAVEIIDDLAKEADFFSIGTNDLIQYTLAVDRTNEKVADNYVPHHPAILRSLNRVMDAAIRHKRDVSVCGDMAHDPAYVPFLIGIGLRKFSLDARYLPKIQKSILKTDSKSARRQAMDLLTKKTVRETEKIIKSEV